VSEAQGPYTFLRGGRISEPGKSTVDFDDTLAEGYVPTSICVILSEAARRLKRRSIDEVFSQV
jgi:hypothetical protein